MHIAIYAVHLISLCREIKWTAYKRLYHFHVGLESLTRKRLNTDFIMCYKILHNFVSIDSDEFLSILQYAFTRDNLMKLKKPQILSTCDRRFFTSHVINMRNSLPNGIVTAPTVGCFKADSITSYAHCFYY